MVLIFESGVDFGVFLIGGSDLGEGEKTKKCSGKNDKKVWSGSQFKNGYQKSRGGL